jgi:polyhydroxyalkanoate synthesis regulator phasin
VKFITILFLFLLTTSAFGELTKEDIRTIVKEEVTASEKHTREYIDLKVDALDQKLSARIDGVEKSLNAKIDALETSVDSRFDALGKSMDSRFDAVDKKLDWVWYMMIALIGLVTAAIAVPQIIMAYRERGRKEMETRQEALQTEIQQLRERLAALEHPPS